MLSDEERKAIDYLQLCYDLSTITNESLSKLSIVLNLIEKQSKEIEELKGDRKSYAEEYIHNNPWLYKQLNENYILRVESEQKERKAWIKGTNDADELCNKKWKDKIKAIIEEVNKKYKAIESNYTEQAIDDGDFELNDYVELQSIQYADDILQSLLEKE